VIYRDPVFLGAEVCLKIRAAMDRGQSEPAEVLRGGMTLDRTVRHASSIDIDPEALNVVDARLDMARDGIATFYSLPLVEREGSSFLRYSAGGFYKPHRDRGFMASWPGAAKRQIALVIFLNASSATPAGGQFSGGELRLLDGPDAPVEIIPQQGMLVAFPATTLHEVSPVRAGTRDAVVDWFY
jgi:predicted 2-oxoglutarate/Fe(II)-dependent dioxygenase YbiX